MGIKIQEKSFFSGEKFYDLKRDCAIIGENEQERRGIHMQYIMGMIGYGGMADHHRRQIEKDIPSIKVKGMVDIRPEMQEKAKKDGLQVFESAEALLADSEIDVVLVATTNDVHKKFIIQSLQAGKHVISEKPVALNSNELEEIIAVAKETEKIFTVHQNRRWDKDFLKIKKIVDDNILGTPYFIESKAPGARGSMYGWRGHKENGGGMLLDWGVHLIDQILYLVDSKVVSVDAHLINAYSDQVDDNFKVFLRFENGLSSVIKMETNGCVSKPRWHMSCLDGTAIIQDWSLEGKMVQLKADSELGWSDEIVYTEAGPTRTMAPRPSYTTQELPLPEVTGEWAEFYYNFVDVLEGKAEQMVKPEEVLRVMKVIDLAFEANREKKGIRCCI